MALDQLHEHERYNRKQGEMSFIDHIIELRKHIVRSVIAIVIGAALCFVFPGFVFQTLLFGPKQADFVTFRLICRLSRQTGLGDRLCFTPNPFDVLTVQLGETLMQHLYLSFWIGFVVAFPYIFWQFWQFISPGMTDRERSATRNIIGVCAALFLFGVSFGYFIIAPFSISFLAGYAVDGVKVSASLSSFVSYMTMLTIPIGLVFQLPVVIYFMTQLGIVGPAFLKSARRYAFLIILIVSAIITPPDVMSQMIVALPLYALYEISIIVSGRVYAKRIKALKQSIA
ncbi:MAG: twin-arginine translocase subunit TatC [Saprospiraceae bacterium]